jgi:membrane protein
VVATFLSLGISLAFSAYVNNFGQYNQLYGSIGTLMVILLWIYMNAFVLLLGYDINASLKRVSLNQSEGPAKMP